MFCHSSVHSFASKTLRLLLPDLKQRLTDKALARTVTCSKGFVQQPSYNSKAVTLCQACLEVYQMIKMSAVFACLVTVTHVPDSNVPEFCGELVLQSKFTCEAALLQMCRLQQANKLIDLA